MVRAKKIGKWFLITLAGLLGLFLLFIVIIYTFEDKIKQYAVDRINQNLNTEIKVTDINLSIWSNFPYASLDFKNVYLQDPSTVNKERDTMLYARNLSLEFSIWDIFDGNYSVKEIKISDAVIKLYIDENGNENYHFWKDSKEKTGSKFEFDLQRVIIERARVSYKNRLNDQNYHFFTDETTLSGNFREKEFELKAESSLFVKRFSSGLITLLRKKQSNLSLGIHVDLPKEKLTFNRGSLKIEDLLLDVSGWIGIGDSTSCDLGLKTNSVQLESIYKIFPKRFSEHLQHYDSKGEVKIDASMKGLISKSSSPVIQIDFSVKDGSMVEKESRVELSELNFAGHYTNLNENFTDEILFPQISGKFLDGNFKAFLGIKNFTDPKIKIDVDGDFNLSTLHQFIRPPRIEKMSGNLHTSIHLLSSIDSENETMQLIQASGKAKVKNVAITSSSLALDLTDIKGLIEIKNNDASIEGLSGKKGSSDFEVNGVIKNFMPYALKSNQHINIVASLISENIRLEDFLSRKTSVDEQSAEEGEYYFPSLINFNLDANVGKLTYGEFEARKLKGNFKLIDQKFTGSKLEMRMAGGNCKGNILVDGSGKKGFVIETKQKLEDISVDKLFTSFENFGQKEITASNIKGKLNADIDFFSYVDNQLHLHGDKVVSTIDLAIENGELNNFLLLSDVVKYLREDKFYKTIIGKKNLDRLDQQVHSIRFSTLKNTISIRNEEILIPKMKVESNTIGLNLYGKHKFNNDIDYHISFRFKDLKMDKKELEANDDDGKGLKVYLLISGNVNDPKYNFDKQEMKNDIKENIELEKKDLKSVLKTELGLYRNDTAVKLKETPKEEVKFLYEWDTEKKETDENSSPEEKKERERKRVKKQKAKSNVNNEPKEEVKFTFDEE